MANYQEARVKLTNAQLKKIKICCKKQASSNIKNK